MADQPDLIVGGDDGDSAQYIFSDVSRAVRLSDGRIVVADDGYSEVLRWFDADGGFLRSYGRPGMGPEEFLQVAALQRMSGDTVFVVAGFSGRLTAFAPGGDVVHHGSLVPIGSDPPSGLARLRDGRWVGFWTRFPEGTVFPTKGIVRQEAIVVVLVPEGSSVDTIGRFPGTEIGFFSIGGNGMSGWVPFGRTFGFDAAGDDIYIGTGDAMAVDVHSADGSLRTSLRARGFDLTITAADNAALEQSTLARAPANENMRRMLLMYLENAPRPPRKAAYRGILVDAHRNVWLSPPANDLLGEGPWRASGATRPPWRVFAQSGEYLGEVEIPPAFRPLEIGDDYMVGRWTGELGIESIRLYRLIKGT